MKPLVIYHDNCTDGFGAAFAAWLKLGDAAEYLPMQYGSDFPYLTEIEATNCEVYILDFSFPREVMDIVFLHAKSVAWLDHHKTAFEMWCPEFGAVSSFTDVAYEGWHYIKLDNNKSGALLAWEYFHPCTEVPLLIQHIDDRDRWQFKLQGTKELHAALASMKPWSFEQWKKLFMIEDQNLDGPFFSDELCRVLRISGAAILRAQNAAILQIVQNARGCSIGLPVPVSIMGGNSWDIRAGLAVSSPIYQSEIGHELAAKCGTYGLIWYVDAAGKVQVSLRSSGDYDVSAIAKQFGGGGHKNAAGFTTSLEELAGWLSLTDSTE